jgi:hypothetical protein
VELPNSCVVIELGMDEMPLIFGMDSLVLCLPVVKVSPFHVIFLFEWGSSRHTLQ